jgi:hypothetical protein
MATYRAAKRFRRNGAWIAPGETVEMPEAAAAKLPKGVIVPVKKTDAPEQPEGKKK